MNVETSRCEMNAEETCCCLRIFTDLFLDEAETEQAIVEKKEEEARRKKKVEVACEVESLKLQVPITL